MLGYVYLLPDIVSTSAHLGGMLHIFDSSNKAAHDLLFCVGFLGDSCVLCAFANAFNQAFYGFVDVIEYLHFVSVGSKFFLCNFQVLCNVLDYLQNADVFKSCVCCP